MAYKNTNATQINNIPVEQGTPADGDGMFYNQVTGEWEFAPGGGGPLSLFPITDPAVNAAVTTVVVDAYDGSLITLTAAGNTQAIQSPTDTATIRGFTVINNDTSTNSIDVDGITIDPGASQKFLWDGSAWVPQGAGGGADFTMPPNMVRVDPAEPAVVGERYTTVANALTYINTQTPTATSRWGVEITGNNSENFIIPQYVNIIGTPYQTRLTGTVDTAGSPGAGNVEEYCIWGCEITNLALSVGNGLYLEECIMNGGTPGGGIIINVATIWKSGDFSAVNVITFGASTFIGGTFGTGFQVNNSLVGVGGPITLNGIQANVSNINLTGATLNAGTYRMLESTINLGDQTFNGAYDFIVNNSVWVGDITLQGTTTVTSYLNTHIANDQVSNATLTVDAAGATLNTVGSAHADVTVNSGTWNNEGAIYDNTASGLAATEMQAAIDEVAAGSAFSMPPNLVRVDPDEAEVVGERYVSIANALVYVATQSPSNNDRWGIQVSGVNAESFTIPSYVTIVCAPDTTYLTGAIDTNNTDNSVIFGARIANLALSGTAGIMLRNCVVSGGVTTSTGELVMMDTIVQSGNFTTITVSLWSGCVVGSGTFGTVQASNSTFGLGVPIVVSGGSFIGCNIDFSGGTMNAGSYIIFNSTARIDDEVFNGAYTFIVDQTTWLGDIELQGTATLSAINSTFINLSAATGDITTNAGTSVTTKGCPDVNVIVSGGTWTNTGDAYDNSTSGLTATEVQGAIDELQTLISAEDLWDRVTGTPNYIIPHTPADDIGATGTRINKIWATDLEITNYPSINGTALTDQYLAISDSPSFTGVTTILSATSSLADGVVGATQAPSDNSTLVATTAYVDAAVLVEDFWDRTATQISPKTAGDDVVSNTGGDIGLTGNRWAKGWFTDLESTNAPTVSGSAVYYTGGPDVGQADGGTNLDSSGVIDGQLLIGDSTANTWALATITPTTNQVNVTNGNGTITLSTPQDIHSGASPTFVGATLSGLTQGSVIFSGAGGVVSQDNASLFFNDTNNNLGIGTATPDAVAKLDLTSTTQGFLAPRMTTAQRIAITAVEGLQVFNTTAGLEYPYFYSTDDTKWKPMGLHGDFYQFGESAGESSTTLAAYQQKLRITTPTLPAGDYKISWFYNYSSDDENAPMDFQVEVDDTTQIFNATPTQKKKYADGVYNSASGFYTITLTNATHTIDLDYANTNSKITYIKEARLEILRVG